MVLCCVVLCCVVLYCVVLYRWYVFVSQSPAVFPIPIIYLIYTIHSGMLMGKEEHTTNTKFYLSDGSGTIECKLWAEKESGGYMRLQSINDNCYVRVCGNMREYEGMKHILVYDVREVTNFNEVTYHILDIILTHCQNTKGPIPGSASAVGAAQGKMDQQTPMRGGGAPGPMFNGGAGGVSIKPEGPGGNLAEEIYQCYRQCSDTTIGFHYNDVLNLMHQKGKTISMEQLAKEVDTLCADGKLYTTTDEQHYLPTDMDG
jgi:replication factor A2